MRQKIKAWYEGEYIPGQRDPHASFWEMGYYRRHWTARFASWLLSFWLREWKWIIGTVLAIIGLIIGLRKL